MVTSPGAASWTSAPEPGTTPSISPRSTEPASPGSNSLRPSTNAPSPPTRTLKVRSSSRETWSSCLARTESFDAAYAIGTLAFIDPHRSLPALRDGLRPGAPLILSLLHTDLNGLGPSTEVAPRRQMILLRDDPPLPTQMWVLAPQLWEDLLTEYGFRIEAIDLLPHPDASATVIQQLIRARRGTGAGAAGRVDGSAPEPREVNEVRTSTPEAYSSAESHHAGPSTAPNR